VIKEEEKNVETIDQLPKLLVKALLMHDHPHRSSRLSEWRASYRLGQWLTSRKRLMTLKSTQNWVQ